MLDACKAKLGMRNNPFLGASVCAVCSPRQGLHRGYGADALHYYYYYYFQH